MRKYLNGNNIPLTLAVFLASDTYDHEDNTISATALIKPIRQLILAKRVPETQSLVEIAGLLKSRMGTAIHDAIERAWLTNHAEAMAALGYPEKLIKRVVVNPIKLEPGDIPVYVEQRAYKTIMGVTVSGKYDIVAEGRVEDFKSTSVFVYLKGDKDEDYKLQGSIYRWLNPQIITDDHMAINFILTDYMPNRAFDKAYPNTPMPRKLIPLLSLAQTEAYVKERLNLLAFYSDKPEEELPLCTDRELWRGENEFKYYAKADSKRATKVFGTDAGSAYAYRASKGTGVVREIPGEVQACKYCPAFSLCSQKDQLIAEGVLKL